MLENGDRVPRVIVLLNQDGTNGSLGNYSGKYVVLYFYPKDETPGCTKQACSLRDYYAEIQALGGVVIGVSADSVKSHQKFIANHRLPFTLWSDPEKKLIKAFGVYKLKKLFGREYLGITRSTFLIDPEGKIVKVWLRVKPDEQGEEVLAYLKLILIN